jgi:peptide-methionine (R)-S-oxide reductase
MLLTRRDVRTPAADFAQAAASHVRPKHLALARVGIGAAMIARPRLVPGVLGVDSATSARMGWSTQMLGVREVALGAGAVIALRSTDGPAARLWLAAGMLCDTADALAIGGAVLKGRLSKPVGGLIAASALGAALAAWHAMDQV